MGLKSFLLKNEKNGFVKKANNCVRFIHASSRNVIFSIPAFYRAAGGYDSRFRKLKKYKNRHSGERCFVLATGPSLNLEDILTLKNEYTFGMNSVCQLFPHTDWRPTYYGIQDLHVYDKLKDYLLDEKKSEILIGSNVAAKRDLPQSWISFPLNAAYNDYAQNVKGKFPAKASKNCYSVVYNGYSITMSLLQIAIYMGFKEIYLLGADCSFGAQQRNHFLEHGHTDARIETAQARNLAGYRAVKILAEKTGVKIFNSTRGGELELFPRVDFDDIKKVDMNNE